MVQKKKGRPRSFDKDEALAKAVEVFWAKGYDGASLTDLTEAMGLNRPSLYAAFGDKRSMYLKALGQYHEDTVSAASAALKKKSIPPRERIEQFVNAPLNAVQKNDRSGCFLCNASADQSDLDQATKAQVSAGFDLLVTALSSALRDLDRDLSGDEVAAKAQALLSVYVGFRIMVRTGVAIEGLEFAASQAVQSMLPRS